LAIKAVVFDLDGTLLDTETCEYEIISGIYAEHGQELPLEIWAECIGTVGGFDPYADLEARTGRTLDREALRNLHRTRHDESVKNISICSGVLDRLKEARRLGLKIGLASSSSRDWIEKNLERQGIREYFEIIRSSNDVERVKPDPALYRLAVEALGVRPDEAIAIEDSRNGLRAAKAAGLWGLVVPNPVTAHLDFSEADRIVGSLEELTFEGLLKEIEAKKFVG